MNECVDNELWKTIQFLFDYRNEIVHGKPFISERIESEEGYIIKYEGRLSSVFDFLKEKKVVSKESQGILTTNIADFFWISTKIFIVEIANKLKNEKNELVSLMLNDIIQDKN
ncbi:MAG: hypothetical protein F9K45_06470 [Melioribacteraceae bacterium]|nr:MAG: hypothetical protein F9K45_06470 [Melioribacteraceae bacterium]